MNLISSLIPSGDDAKNLAVRLLDNMVHQSFLRGSTSNLPTLIDLVMEHFSDDEFAPVIQQTVRDKRVFLLHYVHGSGERLQQLLFTINAAKSCSAEKVVVILPYYPFCRQDKTMNKRTSLGAKVVAKQLQAVGADAVICFDPHAAQIQGFFDIPVDMISGLLIFKPCLDELLQTLNRAKVTFASPDEGGTKRTKKFKEAYPGSSMVMIDKSRAKANEIASMELIGNVEGQDVIFVDDLADTCGTICRAADLVMERGANSVRAVITHPVLSGQAYENINKSKLTELIVSDTIPIDRTKSEKIRVVSIAPTLAQVMLRLTNSQSVSEINH